MDQDSIQGVTNGWSLNLGVTNDYDGALQIGALIHEQMADAHPTGDDGDAAVLAAELVQPCAAARDDHIDVAIHLQQFQHQSAIRLTDELDGLGRNVRALQPMLDGSGQHPVGADGLAAAAQDYTISRFQAQPGHVHGNVGARFIDHRQHSERDALPAQLETVGQCFFFQYLPHRVG